MLPLRSPRRTWLSAALLSAALLILPAIVWLLVPRPSRFTFALPPRPPRTEAATIPAEVARAAPPAQTSSSASNAAPKAPPAQVSPPSPAAAVSGVVLDPSGAPIAGANVRCEDRPDQEIAAQSADEGRFELPPEAAGCLAVARHAAHNPSEGVKLVAGRQNTLRLRGGGVIEGTAADEGGRPVSKYRIAIESFVPRAEGGRRPPGSRSRGVDDPSGAFRLEDLAPGTYMLTASAEGRPPVKTTPIEVEAGQVTRHVRIVLPQGARLSGRVLDATTRRPVEGAVVALDTVTATDANLVAPARTDAAGAYVLEGAPAGPFSIRIEHDGYRTKIVPGIVARGATTAADVVLTLRGDGGAGEMELAGIGALLAPSADGVTISMVIPGGPAEAAGLRSGDVVSRIDGATAAQLAMSDCVQRLRGPAGSRVVVGVKREGQVLDVTVTRQVVVR